MIYWLIILLLLVARPADAANVIANAAAALQPGQWVYVPTGGQTTLGLWDAPDIPGGDAGAYTMETSPKGTWDSTNHRIYWMGGAHGASLPSYGYSAFNKYDAVNDAWTILGVAYQPVGATVYCPIAYPCGASDLLTWQTQTKQWGHQYNNATFDTTNGKWYSTQYSEAWLIEYDPAISHPSGQYLATRKADTPFGQGHIFAIQYFPDIDRVVLLAQTGYTFYNPNTNTYGSTPTNADNGIHALDYATPSTVSNPNPYQQWITYSPKDHVIYMGGGNDTGQNFPSGSGCGHAYPGGVQANYYTCIWRMDSSGTLTQIANAPVDVQVEAGSHVGGLLIADPVSGSLLYWGYDIVTGNPHTYVYNPNTNCAQTPNVGCWTTDPAGIQTPPWFTDTSGGSNLMLTIGDISSFVVAMPEYGVVGVMHYMAPGNAKLWLYRHASDFQARCNSAGVIRCFSFDTTADLGTIGFGNNVGMWNNNASNSCNNANDNQRCPEIDNSVAADGTGSLKFTVGSQTNSGGSGQWYANFSSTLATQFGPNSDFYIQWREMHSSTNLNTFYWGIGSTDSALTLSTNTVGTGRTATLTGGTTTFTGQTGRTIYVDPLDLTKGLATITSVTDATHATVTITTAFTATSYVAGGWFTSFATSGGFKQISVGTGDQTGCTPSTTTNCWSSCNDLDIPTQNVNQQGFLESYTSCNTLSWFPNGTITPSATTGSGITLTASIANFDSNYIGWDIVEYATGATAVITAVTDSTHVTANVVTGAFSTTGAISKWYVFVKGPYVPFNQTFSNPLYGGSTDIAFQDRASPYCSYLGTHDTPPRTFPPSGNCFGYFPNEWITYTMHVHVGNLVFGTNTQALVNSHYTLRAARFGQASQTVLDQNVILNAGPVASNERYGKVWLLPYQTNKDPSQITSTSQVWYDSLIISTQDIPDPSGGGGGPTLNPVVVHIGAGKTVRVGNGQVLRSGSN